MLENHHRYELVYLATEDYTKLKPSKIEFDLPTPNYTSKTLEVLLDKYPDYSFYLIMGEDNLASLKKWKNYEYILEHHRILVCPRLQKKDIPEEFKHHKHITFTNVPIVELSSSFIRASIAKHSNVRPMLPEKVWKYIDEMNFYR